MDQATPNHLTAATGGRRQMDFVSPKSRPKPLRPSSPAASSGAKSAITSREVQNSPANSPVDLVNRDQEAQLSQEASSADYDYGAAQASPSSRDYQSSRPIEGETFSGEKSENSNGLNGSTVEQDNGANAGTSSASRPRAVTSAKDAINAMYANRKASAPSGPARPTTLTAREMVNAAASQNAQRAAKSAASVHHGQIQRNLNSTRTSASALLRVAESPRLASDRINAKTSYDPLARPTRPEPKPVPEADQKQEIPVVRTSLKLGADARPKPAPVILPPNARMARIARPVQNESLAAAHRMRSGKLLSRPHPIDAQIIQPNTINPGRQRRVIDSGMKPVSPPAARANTANSSRSNSAVNPRPTPPPESKSQAIRSAAAKVIETRQHANRGPRFRTAPKNYAASQPEPIAMDSSYVMTAPPKISPSHAKSRVAEDMAELGMEAPKSFKNAGDRAPIGQAKSQTVAAGHGRANTEIPTIKETNSSNYSFSRNNREKPVDNNRYAIGGQSPFLKTVNVEKRPLSDTPVTPRPTIERRNVEEKPTKPAKSGRKNVYPKKAAKPEKSRKDKKAEKAAAPRPTVIIPSSHRSKLPLFFLVLFTIILGALVGAAAYLCFFQ